MALLENLTPGIILKGIHPQNAVTIVAVTRHSADSVEIVYKDAASGLGTHLLISTPTPPKVAEPPRKEPARSRSLPIRRASKDALPREH